MLTLKYMSPGQPTKYRPEYCEMVIKHLSEGYSLESFGGVVRTCKNTVYNWEKEHPEFLASIKEGRALQALYWERKGQMMTEDSDSKMTKGSAAVFIWMTKNMLQWRDRSEVKVENTHRLISMDDVSKVLDNPEGQAAIDTIDKLRLTD